MSFDEAQDIVTKFGNNLIELGEFHTKQLLQKQSGKQVLYSLPIEELKHSKWQIQIALAITVAEYVVLLKTEPSDQNRGILIAASSSCRDLAWFTRKPAFFPAKETDSFGLRHCEDALETYWWWRECCERSLQAGTEGSESDSDCPSTQTLIQYWDDVDYNVSSLLNRSVLRAIRQT